MSRKKKQKYDDPYNEGYTHEVLHTSYVIMDMLERHVAETRTAEEYPVVAKAAEKAHQALYDLYQTLGRIGYEDQLIEAAPCASSE